MRMARSACVGLAGLVIALSAIGCGPDPKDLQIQALQDQVNELQRENESLRARLARATSDRDAAVARASELARQNRELQAQLAQRPQERVPAGWEQAGPYAWVDLGTDFLFDSGKVSLKSQGRTKLQEVVSQINEYYPDKMIWVVGHTDAEPITVTKNLYKDNLHLSLMRGATVFRELASLGLPPQRMTAAGQGEFNPKAANDTKGRSATNRRVQIIAVPMPEGMSVAAPPERALEPEKGSEPIEK